MSGGGWGWGWGDWERQHHLQYDLNLLDLMDFVVVEKGWNCHGGPTRGWNGYGKR